MQSDWGISNQDMGSFPDDEELPPGHAWFRCDVCGDRWALPDHTQPNCGTCLMRDVKIVPMTKEP